jgi:carbon-monoxide dehydrogenase large subunit
VPRGAVAVDTETGHVEILDYVIVEDGGTLVNPMIADGQVYGGTAQGVGTALYEEMPFDAQGQPLATTLADYLLPSAAEVPAMRIEHLETPSPYTRFGQKGIGEGGAIAPPGGDRQRGERRAWRRSASRSPSRPLTPRRIVEALLKVGQ